MADPMNRQRSNTLTPGEFLKLGLWVEYAVPLFGNLTMYFCSKREGPSAEVYVFSNMNLLGVIDGREPHTLAIRLDGLIGTDGLLALRR